MGSLGKESTATNDDRSDESKKVAQMRALVEAKDPSAKVCI
jgi:hypothetical protein